MKDDAFAVAQRLEVQRGSAKGIVEELRQLAHALPSQDTIVMGDVFPAIYFVCDESLICVRFELDGSVTVSASYDADALVLDAILDTVHAFGLAVG